MSNFHPTALVETDLIGEGTTIWAYAHIMQGAVIGNGCTIGDHCFIEPGARIGNNVVIKNNNMIWSGVIIEDGAFVGPGVFFTNDRYPRSRRLEAASKRYEDNSWLLPTLVKQGASLGAATIILPGITVGEYAMTGAGSLIAADVTPFALMSGSPATRKGWVCRCGLPISFNYRAATCSSCQCRFKIDSGVVLLEDIP